MPTFVYPSLLWGMLIVAVPVLIHLINMMRHRRVRWAAMDFLLASQKKNRAWVLLKQLLLLLLRMGIVAAVVAAVAQPLLRGDLAGLLGGGKTHHVVLLDDSFSMSDRWADTSAMRRGKDVVQSIANVAAGRAQPQTFTLLRFSRAGRMGQGTRPDLWEENVDMQFDKRLAKKLEPIRASQTAADPLRAIQALQQLLGESDEERRVVYLLSDFRRRNWAEADAIRGRLEELSAQGSELRLVNCVETARANLAVSGLRATGTRAAGVPLSMEVTVENFGDQPARGVSVVLEEDGHSRPAVKIAEIPPRTVLKQRFDASFPAAGEHRISARLADDAVAADNTRWTVVDLPADVPVLIIDGGAEGLGGWFLATALSPGGPVRTGISTQVESPRFLSLNSLDEYDAIYLANPRRLQPAAIEALETYVAGGGGLAVFLGPQTRSAFINEELYRKGEGVFPLPLGGPAELQPERLWQKPDLEVADHPLFEIFKGQRNSFLATVDVYRYFRAAGPKGTNQWKPAADSGTEVIGRLRNGAPLIVQSRFGKGRVVTFLTTAAPTWNNWARNNPSFVVVVQELQSHIARRPRHGQAGNVGVPLEIELDADDYNATVRFVPPADTTDGQTDGGQTDENAATSASTGVTVNAALDANGVLRASLAKTNRGGIYEVRLTKTDGGNEVRSFAVNVDADEGDLQTVTAAELAGRLEGVDYELLQAANFQLEPHEPSGRNLGDFLLCLLVLMLVGEQILAWSLSYHPPLRRPMGGAIGAKAASGWGGAQ